MIDRLFRFERANQRLATRNVFLRRIVANTGAAAVLVGLSLLTGIIGYHLTEGMSPVDAFLNASMILSGMGPVATLATTAGKIFAGCYALYSGILLVFSSGVVLAPVVHRILHGFHISTEDDHPKEMRHMRPGKPSQSPSDH
jgi:hypothetical protein